MVLVSTLGGGLQRQEAVAWVLGKLCDAYSCNVTMLHKQARHNSSKSCLSTCDLCKEDTAYKHRVGSLILEYMDR